LAQVIADKAGLPINNSSEYYLGAFMPDIRYFTKEPREKYHFPVEKLEPYFEDGIVSLDFLLGYKVHLLIDEVWEYPEIKDNYKNNFPSLIRSRMSRGLQALAFELFCLIRDVTSVKLSPLENALTHDLAIPRDAIDWSVRSMQRYIDQHDLEAAYDMAKETQLFPEARLEQVGSIVRRMKNPLLRAVVFGIVARASKGIFRQVVDEVVRQLKSDYDLKLNQTTTDSTPTSQPQTTSGKV
jgi:hypothetical protein